MAFLLEHFLSQTERDQINELFNAVDIHKRGVIDSESVSWFLSQYDSGVSDIEVAIANIELRL